MARWTLLAAALALVACSSSSTDLCNNGINAVATATNKAFACEGAATTTSTEISAAIATCEVEIMSCTSQDQSALSTAVSCFQNLPPVQCSWYTDAGAPIPDGGATQWQAQAAMCKPTVSSACNVTFTINPAG
jgi:hypothetical protein